MDTFIEGGKPDCHSLLLLCSVSPMQPILPPDLHHVRAATGWLELGCTMDALQELEHLSPEMRSHPDVLELRWLIHAQCKDWSAALQVARELVEAAPDRCSGWLHRAYAMRRVPDGGLQQAWDALHPAFERFPKETLIPYNLACYACQLGQLEDARHWFTAALRTGRKAALRDLALKDDDLRPLWDEIRAMA
jgi:Flp pilus assembly protein TadD